MAIVAGMDDEFTIIWKATLIALRGMSYESRLKLESGKLSHEETKTETARGQRINEEIKFVKDRLKQSGENV